jgi:hypothetical protein
MEIQDFLIAAIQNITVLITHTEEKISKSNAQIGHILGVQRAVGQDFSFLSRLMGLLGQLTKSFARYKEFLTPQRSLICTVV